jgi:hypothetical protein
MVNDSERRFQLILVGLFLLLFVLLGKDIALAMLGAILALAVALFLERTGAPRLNPPGQETSP